MNSLVIKPGEELVQADERVYKIPAKVDLISLFSRDKDITARTIALAREYGTDFHSFFDGIRCTECRHTGLYKEAAKKGVAITRGGSTPGPCEYNGKIERISLFSAKKRNVLFWQRKRIFMAKMPSCTVTDAFYGALIERSHLDIFLIGGAEPQDFYFIAEILQNRDLEMLACEQYRELKRLT